MTDTLLSTIITASAAVSVSVCALVVNAYWMSKTFDVLKDRLYSLETKIDILTGSLHEIDKRLSLLEDRIPR